MSNVKPIVFFNTYKSFKITVIPKLLSMKNLHSWKLQRFGKTNFLSSKFLRAMSNEFNWHNYLFTNRFKLFIWIWLKIIKGKREEQLIS